MVCVKFGADPSKGLRPVALEFPMLNMGSTLTEFLSASDMPGELCEYMHENFTVLKANLSADHYTKVMDLIFEKVVFTIADLIKIGLEKKKPPYFFSNLHKALMALRSMLLQEEDMDKTSRMSCLERQILLHGMNTKDLITEVHNYRLEEQSKIVGAPLGMLTVKLWFVHDILHIYILNGRNLKPMDSNGKSDPFVTISLLPQEAFVKVKKMNTRTERFTLHPLYDETFTVKLTKEQRQMKDGMVLFMTKDEDFRGLVSEFMGEAYVSFSEIPEAQGEADVQQTHLKLSVPSDESLNCGAMRVLNHRLPRDFIKTQRTKHDHGRVF